MNYYLNLYIIVAMASLWNRPEAEVPLLGTPITLVMAGDTNSSVLMYNMHDNENTSAMAGRIISSKYSGEYFELLHTGDRNIGFCYAGAADSIFIDPNRIYTDAGIWIQLQKNNNNDTLLFESIGIWRDSVLSLLKIHERSLVIALHNNTNKFYSLASYTAGGEYEAEADSTYHGRIRDLDDFYFVTDQKIFNDLATGKYHVVLQSDDTLTDDGSLSVYCALYGIPYINVEAQHDHLIRQIKMLIFAFQKLVDGV
ncbi:MAG: hypothetical protein M3R25_05020 [Bacteroidota bacterium]|nr:hypothetical protein [Bacteroidota bacterium]